MSQRRDTEWQVDRQALSVGTPDDNQDCCYWKTRSTQERLQALEMNRQIIYGYDPTTARLQRILEITRRSPG